MCQGFYFFLISILLITTYKGLAQTASASLDDLAHVIQQEKDRESVMNAMQDLQKTCQVNLAITTLFEDDFYTASSRETNTLWLQAQEKGISFTIEVNQHKTYTQCQMQVTAALEEVLPEAQREQIITQVIEPIFRSIPVPNDAYTRGLLAGIAALKEILLKKSVPAALITFQASLEQQYGFDQQQYAVHMSDYEQLVVNKEPYTVAWKSVATGRQDKVIAIDEKNNTIPEDIYFTSTTTGNLTNSAAGEKKRQLSLTGKAHQMKESIEVYQGKEKESMLVGKLNVIHYDELKKKLIIVPVNEAAAPDPYVLQTKLNTIYGQATVDWEVVVEKNFITEDEMIQDIDAVPSGLLSNYPKKMKELIQAYRKAEGEEKEAFYIFLINKRSDKLGYMPKKRPYGFAFTGGTNQEQLTTTIAHELAHGAFRLEHTFETYPALAKGSTPNLMDYAGGTQLNKYQWDLIHNPVKMLGWFQEEEEGAMVGIKYDKENVLDLLNAIRNANHDDEEKLDVTHHIKNKIYTYYGRVKIDKEEIELLVEHWYYSGKHIIEPSQNYSYTSSNQSDKIIFNFDGLIANGDVKPLLKIYVEANKAKILEKYLYNDFKQLSADFSITDKVKTNFEKYQEKVFDHEGGFVDDPVDRGGATNKGITFNTFKAYAHEDLGIEPTIENLKILTSEQAATIYKKRYWNVLMADEIRNGSIAFMLYDFNVTSGAHAAKQLQKVLISMNYNVEVNGTIDKKTLRAINSAVSKELFNKFKQKRLEFYQAIVDKSVESYLKDHPDATEKELKKKTQKRFEQGWKNRVNSIFYEE